MASETIELAIERYAAAMLKIELEHQEEYHAERLAKTRAENPEIIDQYRDRMAEDGRALATAILERSEVFLKRARYGLLHPQNKVSRKLFEAVTGVKLPHTSSGTHDAVYGYCGDAMVKYEAGLKAEQDAKENAEAEKKAEADRIYIGKISTKVAAGDWISGGEMLDLARSLAIEVHPRTAGTLKRRIHGCNGGSARISGKGKVPYTVYDLYKEISEVIKSNTTQNV
jgi:hypothetical protein